MPETAAFSPAPDPSGRETGGNRSLHSLLFFAWLSGFILVGSAYAYRLSQYKKLVRLSVPCNDGRLLEMVLRWKGLFRVRRPVRLVFGSARVSPFTVGLFRPVIVLPKCFLREDPEETIEPVIAHEMAHIRHWDDLWNRLQNFIQIVYFFNPVAWIAGRQLHQAREQVCDAAVLSKRALTNKRYGIALLNVIRVRLAPSDDLVLLPGFANEKTRLMKRLQNIKQPAFHGTGHVVGSCMLLAVFGFFTLPMARPSHPPGGDRPHFASPVPGGILRLECGRDWDASLNAYYDHRGVDIGKGGKPGVIVAAASGRVVSGGTDEIFTAYREITLCHGNGIRTRYLHLDTLFVRPGESVEKGQALGRAPFCLHFEVLKDGRIEDPELYLTLPKQLSRKVVKY
jgi:murein DD-endopeptidase MepM/ murein hydrolase activator NlpD